MTENPVKKQKSKKEIEREERMAAKLRENLRRRKEQTRERKIADKS